MQKEIWKPVKVLKNKTGQKKYISDSNTNSNKIKIITTQLKKKKY